MKNKKNIACLFGSFNPIHIGHLDLAKLTINTLGYIDEVCFIISPHNPFKSNNDLVDENLRREMVSMMIVGDDKRFKVCDIEFSLPKPSYTYNTISELHKAYPDYIFHLIIGSDALNEIDRWKNYEEVIQLPIIGVTRNGVDIIDKIKTIIKNLTIIKSEKNISSTFIRNEIKNGNIDRLELNKKIMDFIKHNNLYNYK